MSVLLPVFNLHNMTRTFQENKSCRSSVTVYFFHQLFSSFYFSLFVVFLSAFNFSFFASSYPIVIFFLNSPLFCFVFLHILFLSFSIFFFFLFLSSYYTCSSFLAFPASFLSSSIPYLYPLPFSHSPLLPYPSILSHFLSLGHSPFI